MGNLIILLLIWVVIGLILGYAASAIFKRERPYGLNGDLIAAIITVIVVGLADWYLIPLMLPNMARLWVFIAALVEPALGALLVLWLMRYFKKTQPG